MLKRVSLTVFVLFATSSALFAQATAAINGRVVDAQGKGLQGVEIVLEPTEQSNVPRREASFAQTTANGVYRVRAAAGDYYVRAYVGEPLRTAKGDRAPVFVNTFYPGVRAKEEAQPLRVDGGLDLYDIDFTLSTGALVRVGGRIVDPSGDSVSGLRVHFMNHAAGPPTIQDYFTLTICSCMFIHRLVIATPLLMTCSG